MSWSHFVRKSRTVKLGGRKLGPLVIGGRRYRFGPISLLRMVQWLSERRPGLDPDSMVRLPLEALRALIPLSVVGPMRAGDLERATAEQIAMASIAAAEVTDLPYVLKRLLPPPDQPKAKGLGMDAAVCSVAQRYHVEPRTVWLWPAAEFVAVLDAEEQLNPKDPNDREAHVCDADERAELNAKLAAHGLELDGDG